MSLDSRRDNRSVDTFARNIQDFTERERVWANALQLDWSSRGRVCTLRDNGVDNTGRLIRGTLANHAADFVFVFGATLEARLVEIKTCPPHLRSFMTFKVSSLESCVSHGAYIAVPRKRYYYLFHPEVLVNWLEAYPKEFYPNFSPNDLAIRVQVDDMGPPEVWTPEAQQYVNANLDLLFREKQT
jgi:hypothetical protein